MYLYILLNSWAQRLVFKKSNKRLTVLIWSICSLASQLFTRRRWVASMPLFIVSFLVEQTLIWLTRFVTFSKFIRCRPRARSRDDGNAFYFLQVLCFSKSRLFIAAFLFFHAKEHGETASKASGSAKHKTLLFSLPQPPPLPDSRFALASSSLMILFLRLTIEEKCGKIEGCEQSMPKVKGSCVISRMCRNGF